MIRLGQLEFNPLKENKEVILSALDQYSTQSKEKVWVRWYDYSMTQQEALQYYLPLVHHAQSLGLEVWCMMPMDMGKHLVRNKRLMFVDPLFLRHFHFKRIEFELPFKRPKELDKYFK